MNINDINNAPKYAGIYCFKNTINGKCYIGQAIKLRKRLQHHWYNWNNERYSQLLIYRAFKKYGIEKFELIILETFRDALDFNTKLKLDKLEKKYIAEYNSYENGYNMTLGEDTGVLGLKMADEQKEKIRNASLKQQEDIRQELSKNSDNWIKCKNIKTEEILIFKTKREASETLLIKEYMISRCLNKQYHLVNKTWQICYNCEEFEKIPEYGTFEFDSWNCTQFKSLSNKEEICEYIKNNPKSPYAEVKQFFNLSKQAYYNYRKELGIKFDQRIDTKVGKNEFLEYAKGHTKEECMFHFNIPERAYYTYKKKYQE